MFSAEHAIGLLRQYFTDWKIMLHRHEESAHVSLIMTKKLRETSLIKDLNTTIRDLARDFRDNASDYFAPPKPLFCRPTWRNIRRRKWTVRPQ